MLFEEFQDGPHGGHLRYHQVLAQTNLWFERSFEEFQNGCHGGHLGYQNQMILAILNLCVTLMPSIKFRLSMTYGLGGNVV